MPFAFPNNEILLLDGGFGTTLEDLFEKDISSALWSASLVDKEPDTIVNAHSTFLEAGSDIFLTSTYQCAFETFNRAGYSEADAVRLMRKAVHLASLAKKKRITSSSAPLKPKIVLSLGPFGATLSPAQEFDGIYPPPYGPRAYDASGANTSAFTDAALAEASIDALAHFHYSRLRVFIDDLNTKEEEEEKGAIWSAIDGLAFETVPLVREVTAIRRAMGCLARDLEVRDLPAKPWWVSTVWPGGVHPQEKPGGGRLAAKDVAHALLSEETASLPTPDGIGINCTHIDDLDTVAQSFRVSTPSLSSVSAKAPFLVLYPNGGGVYDIVNHCWKGAQQLDASASEHAADAWSRQLVAIAKRERESGVWRGVIIGGCCKTGPRHIELLSRALQKSNLPLFDL